MTDKRFEELLLGLVRNGMGIPSPLPSIRKEDIQPLEELGLRHSILPILWEGMRTQELPADWVRSMDRNRLKSIYRCLMRSDALEQISQCFQTAGIAYLPLKGAVLQELYPEPWMRTSSDLDILVREEEVSRAVACLEESTDFRFEKRNYHDVSLLSKQVRLELHFSIKENMPKLDPLLSRVWDYAEATEDGCRFVLSPEYQIFHVLAHMSYHMVCGGLGIRPFLDLWLLREKTEYDEEKLREMCRCSGILKFYEVSCEMLEVWMRRGAHTETTGALQELCLNGSLYGSDDRGARQREHRGLSYLLHRLFVGRNVLEEMYPALRSRPLLLPLYQIKRWTRLRSPEKRKSAMAELERTRSVSEESIKAYDALLKSLGL